MRIRPIAAALTLTLTLAGAAVLGPAALPAAAHGDTVHLEVAGVEGGHVTAVATWENDHDPVTEEFAGTMAATSDDGRSAGPWRLVAVPGRPGSYTTREFLPAGHWRITVDCAFPSLGHGERELDVEAAPITDPTLPTPPSPATSTATAVPTPGPTAVPTLGPAPAPTTPTVGPTADPTAGPTTAPTGTAASPSASPGPNAAATAGSDSASNVAAWAAVGTAALAVALVAVGFRLRRRARGR
ncbi:hypothetical protein RMN57_34380 [Kitasatospora sp. CM 4170]|uniref:Uncharacterized protein n=1 Tax=Kitasatospora aburaviensis TaxID=67265 RepID=A0ABW1F1M8_9ACTN|nr:hypothetical protein [Kitasatospora sp. CM 4170]WNM49421.1 hypothetical protein RMN57_34380 [Kitasatospora sp. CM 4170]